MHAWTCSHACTHPCTHTCKLPHTPQAHTCTHIPHACMHMHTCTHTHTHKHTHAHTYTHTCTHTHACTHACIHTHTHKHTHTHRYTNPPLPRHETRFSFLMQIDRQIDCTVNVGGSTVKCNKLKRKIMDRNNYHHLPVSESFLVWTLGVKQGKCSQERPAFELINEHSKIWWSMGKRHWKDICYLNNSCHHHQSSWSKNREGILYLIMGSCC